MPIVGTAGHVDHGKSTLVQALTGRDPDRWTEEKERGLTIDLGFAWTDIDGVDVGFVDVPGHERFIKNMLAGIGAIDCALLVVAADSGWMPQTEEHAAVLDLLKIRNGVIALSRIDLVDDDMVELATLEIMDETVGTVLADWPIVPVSPVSGAGLDELRSGISDVIAESSHQPTLPFRLWVDRAFTVSGAGVVVTGTMGRGTLTVADDVEILPSGQRDRVRGLHHHDHAAEQVFGGSRTAVNLQSTKLVEVDRGSVLCEPGSLAISDTFVAKVRPARAFEEIPRRGAFHIHIGTAHVPARIRQLDGVEVFRIDLDHPLPMAMGDRFILRDSGRQAVVGGGTVLDPVARYRPSPEQIDVLAGAVDGSPDEKADALLAVRDRAEIGELSAATGGGIPISGLRAGAFIVSDAEVRRIRSAIADAVTSYHRQHPLRPGAPKAALASQLDVPLDMLNVLIDSGEHFAESDGYIHMIDFVDQLPDEEVARWEEVRTEMERSFAVPRIRDISLDDETVHSLLRSGDLVQIGSDLAFTRQQVDWIRSRLSDLEDGFSVTQFKDAFGMARRQAVPTLEWLDKTGWTRRTGDTRTVRRRQQSSDDVPSQ